jgi:hypothetical protein
MCFLAEAADGQCRIPYQIRVSVRKVTTHGHMCTTGAHTCQSQPKLCVYNKVPNNSECWCSSGAFAPMEVFRCCERVIRLNVPNSAVGMLYGAPGGRDATAESASSGSNTCARFAGVAGSLQRGSWTDLAPYAWKVTTFVNAFLGY